VFRMMPTLVRTLGIKGERLMVGSNDNKDCTYLFGAVNLIDGALVTCQRPIPHVRGQRTGATKTRVLQSAFIKHLDAVARRYPCDRHPQVVVVIDNAPWHRGKAVRQVLERHAHLQLYRLPSYSPELSPIERFWKVLRRRATHNRQFGELPRLQRSVANSVRYYQVMSHRVVRLLENPFRTLSWSA